MKIKCRNIVTELGVKDGILTIDNGHFTNIASQDDQADYDYEDCIILPGIFDTHNHGYMGWEAGSVKSTLGYLKALASVGVTSVFPTREDEDDTYANISLVSKMKYDGAEIMGIHSEGPYLNRVGEKGVDKGHPDISMDYVKKMVEDGNGMLRLVALAPELPGAYEAIQYFTFHNVRCAMAHSNCNYEEAMQAFQNGVTVTTHTANVMSGIHHRRMGGLGAALLSDEVYNELICDGMHVQNEMIELMFRVKKDAFHKFMMISDNVIVAGFPTGYYKGNGDYDRHITEDGFCLTETGRISGSTKPVLYGIRNLALNLHIPLVEISWMSSLNPCLVYGFADRKGSIRIGKEADFIVLDQDFNCLYTFRKGEKIYDYETDTDLMDHETYNNMKR